MGARLFIQQSATILFFIMAVCTLTACNAGKTGQIDQGGPAQSADTVRSDTMSYDDQGMPEPAPPPIPGSVEVVGVFSSCSQIEHGFRCELTVERVLRYGMSTPVLTAATELVDVETSVIDAIELSGVEGLEGRTVWVLLRSLGPVPPGGREVNWVVRAIRLR